MSASGQDRASTGETRQSAIRTRAFVLAAVIIPLDQYWVIMMEKVRSGPYPTTVSLFPNVVFILALLALSNYLLRRYRRRWALTFAELLLIYTMVAVSAALAGHDMLPTLVGLMTYPWQFATPENRWEQTLLPLLPKTLSVTDPEAGRGLWEGGASLYDDAWKHWLLPTLQWLTFLIALVLVMCCMNTLVRKQWVHRERLTFPIVQLPIAMVEPTGAMWRNQRFWLGFAIASSIVFLNGLSEYVHLLPVINVGFEGRDMAEMLVNKPWSALGWTPVTFYPFVIGIGYLLPTDLVFSCWFFYWMWKAQNVISAMTGLDAINQFPFVRHQTVGGIFAIVVTILWTGKAYFKQVWRKALRKESELDDSDEAISYRSALIGSAAGIAYLCWFMHRIGLSPFLAVIAFAMYFIVATAIGKIRAELGAPIHDFGMMGPDAILTKSVGLAHMDSGDAVGFGYLYWFNRAYRAHPMPIITEGYKLADVTRSSQRKYFLGVMLAVILGMVATFWTYLDVGYRLGFSVGVSGGGSYAWGAVRNIESWLGKPADMMNPSWAANGAFVFGFLFCTALNAIRLKVLGFPFHPIGYVISSSYQINLVWFPLFIAWLAKSFILKYGGLKKYREGIPFFLGLILGEMTLGCLWAIFGIVTGLPYYSFWGQ